MVRGCQRRIIRLHTTGSGMFEEAYFILKPERGNAPEAMMIAEANRILAEQVNASRPRPRRAGPLLPRLWFALGLGCGGCLVGLLWLLFG